jgi:threonine dehydratase
MNDGVLSTITPARVRDARARIAAYVRHTPLEPSHELSRLVGGNVFLKLESQQVTGSFKPRVSFSKLLALDEARRARGVIASTAGGHGIGLSYAARTLGVAADIYLPSTADPRKVEAIRRNGARMTFFDSVSDASLAASEKAAETGMTVVPAYNDPDVIAGGGTIGLEIMEDLPEVDLVIVGMGGGGVISGMAIALKEARPRLQAWGVQPEANPVLAEWLRHGRPVPVQQQASIADGLGASIEEDSLTFPLALRYVDRTVLVSDAEIKDAMAWLLEEHQMVVEPSGAAPVAALMKARPLGFRNVVVVVTGRNISRPRYVDLLDGRLFA